MSPNQETRSIHPHRGRRSKAARMVVVLVLGVSCSFLTACKADEDPGPVGLVDRPPKAPGDRPPSTHPLTQAPLETWQRWASGEVEHYDLPEMNTNDVYDLLGFFLDRIEAPKIELVDVGCAVGDYLRRLDRYLDKPIHSLGIDPLDWDGRVEYSSFLQVAVANQEPSQAEFHLYGGPDLATSSLKRMKTENVSHSEDEKDDKFYHPIDIETEHGTITVDVVPLSKVVEESNLQDTTLHLVKVDVQGTDLGSFLSLHDYIPNVLFFQIESILSENEGHKLYDDQLLFDEEKRVLEDLGFRIFNIARFPAGPEADVMWVNTRLFAELAPQVGLTLPQTEDPARAPDSDQDLAAGTS